MDPDVYRRMAEIQDTHWWYEGRRHILRAMIRRLKLTQPARILEVGCGPGANLRMLQEFGTVQGIEPDEFARERAAALTGCAVSGGLLPDGLAVTGPFDLIGAFDVIEHVERDRESLATLQRLLSPGGYALFTVPTFPFLWSRHDEVNHHWRRYRRAEFAAKLQEAGFEIVFLSYYNMVLFPAVAAVRLFKKSLRLQDSPDETMPPLILNTILRMLFSAEASLLTLMRLPFGVSLLAVCRRA